MMPASFDKIAVELFDLVPTSVFFIKDEKGRYLMVNQALVERCGKKTKAELIGRTVSELYPPDLAASYYAQDRSVLRTGQPIFDKLELQLYANRLPGWCLTSKIPVRNRAGRVMGLAGISRDIGVSDEGQVFPRSLIEAVEHLQQHYDQPIEVGELAAKAGLSLERFSRLVKQIFQLTPGQLLIQTRLQMAALRLRESEETIAVIAHASGFCDHSAFTRKFKETTGMTPLAYRRASRAGS